MSANKFASPRLSEAQELFVATLIEPPMAEGMPKLIGKKEVGEKYRDGSTYSRASIDFFGKRANPELGTPAKLDALILNWDSRLSSKGLPHLIRKFADRPDQKAWKCTSSEDSVTMTLGELSITGLFDPETNSSLRVEGSVEAIESQKRVIEKLIEHTVIPDKKVPQSGIIKRYDRSPEAAEAATLSYGGVLIRCVEGVSNGQNISDLISGIEMPAHEPEQVLLNVA